MHRLLSIGRRGTWLAALLLAAVAQAQEPPPGDAPHAAAPIVPPPRDDVYSVYTDAFYNPQSLACDACDPAAGGMTGSFFQQLFAPMRYTRFYAGSDVMWYQRTKPGAKVLVTVTNNIFPFLPPSNFSPATQSTTQLNPRFQGFGQAAFYPVTSARQPTDPSLNQVYIQNPDGTAQAIGSIPGILSPNAIRMTTNDFNYGTATGIRPKIGAVLPDGNVIEFNYMYFWDWKPATLVDDVSGSAFFTQVLGTDVYQFQRFGYLNSPFQTQDVRFQGERRLPLVNNPAVEVPPVTATTNSAAVPREPTNLDQATPFGLLWTDGELAVAQYRFNLQGAELVYKRSMFDFARGNYYLNFLFGVRYIALYEDFAFFFADTTLDRAALPGNSNFAPGSPTDPREPNSFPKSQPVSEVVATYSNSIDNNMVGPEIGADVRFPFLYYFELELMTKGSWMGNFLTRTTSMIRGDGATLYNYTKDRFSTSGAIEGQFGLNFRPLPNVLVKGGWEYIWLIDISTAVGSIDFNLANQRKAPTNDNVFFNGAYCGLEITY